MKSPKKVPPPRLVVVSPISDQDSWRKCPTLDSYRERIGAVVESFRRAVVKAESEEGYWREVAIVRNQGWQTAMRLSPFSALTMEDREKLEPTKEEREAAEKEIAAAGFPKSISARDLKKLIPQMSGGPYYEFHDRTNDGGVIMVQERIEPKGYVPWTFFSDGEWRRMEPDGLLPLYGLDRLKNATTVFLHEGPKAARAVQEMVDAGGNALKEHPWGEALKGAAHLGWPGGAERPHRVDWSPISKLPPSVQVILVCDNDRVGVEASTIISATLRRHLTAIMFDDRFAGGFDLADAWPQHPEWWRKGRYKGPSFDDFLVPATWATDTVHGEQGRPSFKVRKEFAAEWLWAEDPPVFVYRKQTNRLRNNDAFNRSVRPFSDAENTARLLVQNVSSKCDGITYAPGLRDGVINVDGRRLINCYRPPIIKAIDGDPKPFLDFMKHLVPDEGDRRELSRWCATLIARPDTRMSYGVLMVSESQGVGKGTLGEAILTPLVGEWNVSFPDEQQMTESAFNSWLAHKRLSVVHEIYAGHSVKAYNRLKSVITDKLVTVNEKFMPAYTLENFIHVFACSNSKRALRLDDNDRRWLVPRVTEENQSAEFWRGLNEWLKDDGLGIIKCWAEKFLLKNEAVRRGEHAPRTTAKSEMISEGRSVGEQLAYDLGVSVREMMEQEPPVKVVLAVEDVRNFVASMRNLDLNADKLERPLTLRKALKAAGLKEPARKAGSEQQRFQINPTCKSHVVANYVISERDTWPKIQKHYKKPDDIGKT